MAILGFIVLMVIGLYFLAAATICVIMCIGFAGRLKGSDKASVAIFLAISASCLYFAITNCPFTVGLKP